MSLRVLTVVVLQGIGMHLGAQAVAVSMSPQATAQTGPEKISVSFQNTPLTDALWTIARRSGTNVTFDRRMIPTRQVNYRAENITPDIAFAAVLKGTGLRVNRAANGTLVVVGSKAASDSRAQGVVSGKVIDAKTGKGIPNVGVSVAAEVRGTSTDESGVYRLTRVPAGIHTVTVRMVGYAKQSRSVTVSEGVTVIADFKLEQSANVLDQVIVTGTVAQTELKAVPNAITVIAAKQIEERGITRIDQLFRGDVPGLFSLNRGSETFLEQVTMFSRGATALSTSSAGTLNNTNPIKTYIDGVEMADSRYLSQIDPKSIERIEILTGPQASTIYGANAINGVMQIFTKRGTSNKPQLTVDINSGVIQNNYSSGLAPNHLLDAAATGTEGRWSYNVGGSWNYIGAWTPGRQTQRLSFYGGGRSEWGKLSADMSARRGVTQNRQNGDLLQEFTDLRGSGLWSPDAGAGLPQPQTQSLNGHTLGFSLSYRPSLWWSHEVVLGSDASVTETLRTGPGLVTVDDTLLNISQGTTSRISQRYNSTMQIPVSSQAKLNLTYGGDHWRTGGSTWNATTLSLTGQLPNPFVSRTKPSWNKGAFVQGQLSMFDALFFTYGVRADWNPGFGENAKVRPGRYGLSMARDIDTPLGTVSAKLRGSYGRSIRPPTANFKLAARNSNSARLIQFGPFDNRLANLDLGPEHQQGGEGGLELYFASRGSLVITRFNQTVDNLISSVSNVDSVRSLLPRFPSTTNCGVDINGVRPYDSEGHCFWYQTQFLNVGGIRNQGWELQGTANLGPITTRGTYSWVKSRVIGVTPRYRHLLQVTNPEIQPGNSFDFVPEHTWGLGVTYAESNSTVSLSVSGIGMRYIQGNDLNLAVSGASRFDLTRPRTSLSGYRPLGSGYATADLNATHRFSTRMDAMLQINNLTDYYQNDLDASYATAGRSSRVGARIRW